MQPVVTTPVNGPPLSFPTGPGVGKNNYKDLFGLFIYLFIIICKIPPSPLHLL